MVLITFNKLDFYLTWIYCLLNIIITKIGDGQTFSYLGLERFWNFHTTIIWALLFNQSFKTLILFLETRLHNSNLIELSTINDNILSIYRCGISMGIIGIIFTLFCSYTQILIIWQQYPRLMLPIYNTFWTTSLTLNTTLLDNNIIIKKNIYIFSDFLIRLYSIYSILGLVIFIISLVHFCCR